MNLHGPLRDFSAAGERVLAETFARLGLDHDPAYADATDADLVLRTVGFHAPAWLAASGLPVDAVCDTFVTSVVDGARWFGKNSDRERDEVQLWRSSRPGGPAGPSAARTSPCRTWRRRGR